MNRHRLTFDPTPKELAARDSSGTHVLLLWSRRTGRAAVVLEDPDGEDIEMEVREHEKPFELFQHPFVYAAQRGHPGWNAQHAGASDRAIGAGTSCAHRAGPSQPA